MVYIIVGLAATVAGALAFTFFAIRTDRSAPKDPPSE